MHPRCAPPGLALSPLFLPATRARGKRPRRHRFGARPALLLPLLTPHRDATTRLPWPTRSRPRAAVSLRSSPRRTMLVPSASLLGTRRYVVSRQITHKNGRIRVENECEERPIDGYITVFLYHPLEDGTGTQQLLEPLKQPEQSEAAAIVLLATRQSDIKKRPS